MRLAVLALLPVALATSKVYYTTGEGVNAPRIDEYISHHCALKSNINGQIYSRYFFCGAPEVLVGTNQENPDPKHLQFSRGECFDKSVKGKYWPCKVPGAIVATRCTGPDPDKPK
ncbi:predicted protein [Plenodomus lingam JN3]|uniref:Predicted protein n=1 Tax=Leptosphaeria maculans (strain JN3 / isolate v23.1.3 / race Av1-4-5-6-7-8) TaxID=985895 RepID=E4ZLV4_LEPMJ|nr:predicted protein [Plenodomus lingam JN3]CBX92784.1 predicted protein [Plenodomus lingam JN3]